MIVFRTKYLVPYVHSHSSRLSIVISTTSIRINSKNTKELSIIGNTILPSLHQSLSLTNVYYDVRSRLVFSRTFMNSKRTLKGLNLKERRAIQRGFSHPKKSYACKFLVLAKAFYSKNMLRQGIEREVIWAASYIYYILLLLAKEVFE